MKFRILTAIFALFLISSPLISLSQEKQAPVGMLEFQAVISKSSYDEFVAAFDTLLKSNVKTIIISLNSPGGNFKYGMDMISVILEYQMSGGRIIMLVTDDAICMSMCTAVFSVGDQRYTGKEAEWMFHSPRIGEESSSLTKNLPVETILDSVREHMTAIYKSADPKFAKDVLEYLYSDKELRITGEELAKSYPNYVTVAVPEE